MVGFSNPRLFLINICKAVRHQAGGKDLAATSEYPIGLGLKARPVCMCWISNICIYIYINYLEARLPERLNQKI